ncbi:MAG: thioredoxin domain-containing protein [Campylobacterota bacterium]|nr:thioredoxin domain-containing protein [Campylobacterota bacterium]
MMKSLTLKSLTILSLLSSTLVANVTDDNVMKYEEQRIKSAIVRAKGTINSIDVVLKKDLQNDGWYGYVFNLDINIQGKKIVQKDTLFAKGNLIAPDLINTKTKRSFKDVMYPKLTKKYFSKEHLIAGNPNAKHTLVIFSDPLCPICIDEVPFTMKNIMKHPSNIALYYYHMPLDMHPTARTLSKASMIAKEQGIKDIDYKVYSKDFSNFYDAYREKDNQKALNFFNKTFNTKITMAQINSKKYNDKIDYDLKMAEDAFVNGTPTVFFDGEIDRRRMKYEAFLKQNNGEVK